MKHYLKYELKNTFGNIFSIIFGILFPIMMTLLFYNMFSSNEAIPKDALALQLYLTNVLMSPLAMVFVGFSALFSQEIEHDVTTRMLLFGYTTSNQLKTKFVAQMVAMGIALAIFSAVIVPLLGIGAPTIFGFIVFIAFFAIISMILFVIAYSITLLTRKFSLTYGISMTLYFATMIFSGMMGIQTSNFKGIMKGISNLLPTTYFVNDMPTVWTATSYNFAPMIQSLVFFAGIAGILYVIAYNKTKRSIH
ncbi:ABC transporter permease [Erysipelothrix aquatica]|uniref:ABC transporter permease n=1 Tax=Erysipelothrix aquatica TaxID=2683714 RepID=UPI00135AC01C|nr:ABC transporter permease [Erysipelothrix aquatica]